jgi:predicted acetylornithine/succinylornithine family transaminase
MTATLESEVDATSVMETDSRNVMGTYMRQPVVFVRGEGARLWDSEGREYLDFLGGIAVVGIGHNHPRVTRAIAEQAGTLMHVSNLFHNPFQAELARRLCGLTGMEKAFFANSGAEANECAIKIARKWAKTHKGPDCYEIISFKGSFHGRTIATVTATAQPKYQEPFAPMPAGFRYLNGWDFAGLQEAVTEKTAAVIIEPIQGESGIHVVPDEFLRALRNLCDERNVLLILDEIQSGNGRTGRYLASEHAGIRGDIVTLAKGIANGVPMGACLARGEAANTLVPGDHGSTFGGQPLACAAALAVLDTLEADDLMENAERVGNHFISALKRLQLMTPKVKEVRGRGLMVGVELSEPIAKIMRDGLLERGVVCNAVGDTILRFLPPLIITESDCDRVEEVLADILSLQ